MKCLTILTVMSGAGGHGIARTLFDNNPQDRWYDHAKNNNKNKNKFSKLHIAEKHFQKAFANGQRFPHLFDRIEPYLKDIDAYYKLIKPEIINCSLGKKLVYTCHASPKDIRQRYKDCYIIQIIPKEEIRLEYFERHMETAMFFPLQTNIDMLPNRRDLLNDLYWAQKEFATLYPQKNSLVEFYKHKGYSKDQIYNTEYANQNELYKLHQKTKEFSDTTIEFSSTSDLNLQLENYTKKSLDY